MVSVFDYKYSKNVGIPQVGHFHIIFQTSALDTDTSMSPAVDNHWNFSMFFSFFPSYSKEKKRRKEEEQEEEQEQEEGQCDMENYS